MATLFLTVFRDADRVLLDEPIQETTVTIAGASAQSAAISGSNKEIRSVRLFADADCFVKWGDNPTALADGTAGMPIGAENPEVVGVKAGQLVAVIERV